MERNEILKLYGTDYKDMTRRLLAKAELERELSLKAAALGTTLASLRIAVKPNLVTCTPAEFGATTHPEIVAGIVEELQDLGCRDITVMEGSWVGDKTAEAFEYCGYNRLAEEYGLKLVDTQKEPSVRKNCAGMELNLCRCTENADFLINVPVLKGHCQTKMTCALKNMKGLIPNTEKRRFHSLGLHRPIAHLNTALRPDFIVVDHICGDPDFEEGGSPLVRNCIMAALDPVLTDAYACRILGWQAEDVEYIGLAEQLGVGSADLNQLRLWVLEEYASEAKGRAVLNGSPVGIQNCEVTESQREIDLQGDDRESPPDTRKLMNVSYAVEEVDSCSACYGQLIGALTRLKEEGLFPEIPEPVSIGQGFRGKSGRCGVGNCTKGFDFTIPGCPPAEEDIYLALKEYYNTSL